MTKTLTPAAGYLRMSSDRQDTSIDDQRSELLAYAAKHGYKIVKWFCDEGVSGWKSKQRPGFLNLIADAKDGEFKCVLCWDQSRFSRFSPVEANFYWHQLSEAGVYIETIKEGKLDFDTLGGWLTASVQQHGKAEYCKSLAADTTRGRRKALLEGRWCWPAPYGYRIENGRLAIGDADKVETVRRIFRMRVKGLGFRSIAKVLNGEGIKSPYGRAWQTRQIEMMLERQTYLGHMVVGEEAKGKFCHVFDEPRTFENTHPPIIDAELWQAAQSVSNSRRTRPGRRPKIGGQLSGLLICGRCGGQMHSRPGGVDIAKYACGTYQTKGGCSFNTVPYDVALKAVADKIRSVVLLGSVEALTAAIEKGLAKRKASQVQTDTASIKRKVADIDRKLEVAADRMLECEAADVKDVRAAMARLRERREALAAKLATAAEDKRKPKSAKQIAAKLWELDSVLREGDAATVRAALSQIIDRVVIDFEPKAMARDPARQRYVPAGGTVFFCSKRDMCSVPHCRNRSDHAPWPFCRRRVGGKCRISSSARRR